MVAVTTASGADDDGEALRYDVQYDDGDREYNVSSRNVRRVQSPTQLAVGDAVQANFKARRLICPGVGFWAECAIVLCAVVASF